MPTVSSPALDLNRIVFPTDKITFGSMRRAEPHLFCAETVQADKSTMIEACYTFSWEMILAHKAFAQVTGRPEPYAEFTRRRIIELLDLGYRVYGLSAGLKQTEELARRIEAQIAREVRHTKR